MSEKTQALLQQLQAEVASLTTEDKWQDYLKLQACFHDYSFRNILLIRAQRPEATAVAGFHGWRQLGRHVRKGEKGIAILAPMVFGRRHEGHGAREHAERTSQGQGHRRKRAGKAGAPRSEDRRHGDEAGPSAGAGDDEETRTVGFRPVYVFDVSQTDGEPLPEPPTKRLEGHEDAAHAAWARLISFADEDLHIPVLDEDMPSSVHGYFDRSARKIAIQRNNPPLQRTKTLAHEIGHALLHADASDSHERPVMEVEAESVAFIVMHHLGIDSGDYSFGYVALWGQEHDAPKLIQACGSRIAQAANRIITHLEKGCVGESSPSPVALVEAERPATQAAYAPAA